MRDLVASADAKSTSTSNDEKYSFAKGGNNNNSDYDRIAGEIESRDVASRINLATEQSKNTRPDIDRTDVLFADDGVDNSKSTEQIVELSNDNELNKLIGNSTGSNKYKIISKYILEKIGTEKIILPDNREAIVDKSDADHIAHSSGNKKTAQISEVDKIIKNSKLVAYENSTKKNKFSIFYYYKSIVKYGKDTFPVYLNVGVAKK